MPTNRPPFIKAVAFFLAAVLSFPQAAFSGGGTAAALRAAPMTPSADAAWSRAVEEVANDPAIPFLGEEETAARLRAWQEEEALSATSRLEAAQAWSARAQGLLGRAYERYYAFGFQEALSLAQEAAAMAPRFGDSGLAAGFAFEAHLLEGMAGKAGGQEQSREAFARAAALRPEAVLPDVRYAPAVREDFDKARALLLAGERGALSVQGAPDGADVFLDGARIGSLPLSDVSVLPGEHFVEVRAPGRQPAMEALSIKPWGRAQLNFALALAGPEGDAGAFFAARLLQGDREFLAALAARLDVDSVLLGSENEGRLEAWLIDRSGKTISAAVLAEPGKEPDPLVANRMVLVQEGLEGEDQGIPMEYSAVPALPPVSEPAEARSAQSGWIWKAAGLAVLILVLSQDRQKETTDVEASW